MNMQSVSSAITSNDFQKESLSKQKLNIEELRNQLRKFYLTKAPNTNINELNELVTEFQVEKIKKKQIIIPAGEVSDYMYFICKGMVRIYYNKEDKEITNWFIQENMLFTSTYAIATQLPNLYNYETIENTIVLKIKYERLESFYNKYHSIANLGRLLILKYYAQFMKKTYDILFLSAEERYSLFLEEHSDLVNRISLRYIASYIGVSQETISRIRAKH